MSFSVYMPNNTTRTHLRSIQKGILAEHLDGTMDHALTSQNTQQCGFSCTVCTHENTTIACVQLQIQMVNDGWAAIREREISHVDRVLVVLVEFVARHEEIVVEKRKRSQH